MGELKMWKEFVAAPPQYPASAIQTQPDYETMIQKQQNNNLAKLQRCKTRMQTLINASTSDSDRADLEDKMFNTNNKIMEVEYNMKINVKVQLTEEEKGE